MHESAAKYHYWSRPNQALRIKKTTSIEVSLPWDGHFAAKHFHENQTDTLELKKIKSSLQKAIIGLPSSHTENLQSIEILNQAHTSRGMANSHKLILHTKSIENQDELISVFIHEMGHITDLGVLKSLNGETTEFRDEDIPIFAEDPSINFYRISWAGESARKPDATRSDFISGYALTNCFEDFAESYLFYRMHGEKFRFLAQSSEKLQAKYDFLKEEVFGGKEFQVGKQVAENFDPLLWDATRLDISQGDLVAVR